MTTTEETLRTGWEPDTPVADTLVRRFLLHFAAACEAVAHSGGGAAHLGEHWRGADTRRPTGYQNAAIILSPPGRAETRVLDEIEAFFAPGRGAAPVWSPWPLETAADRGWRLSGHPPVLARPPASMLAPPDPPPIAVETVRDDASAMEWERTAIDAYPLDELDREEPGTLLPPALLHDDRFRFMLTREGADPVAVGALFRGLGITSLHFGATRPEARGRGHWRRLAIERILSAPDDWLLGIFSDLSRGPAEGLGFVPLVRLNLWIIDRTPRKDT